MKDKILIIEDDSIDFCKIDTIVEEELRVDFEIIPEINCQELNEDNIKIKLNSFLFGDSYSENSKYKEKIGLIKNRIKKIIIEDENYKQIKVIVLDMLLLDGENENLDLTQVSGYEILKFIRELEIYDTLYMNWAKYIPIIVLTKAEGDNNNYSSLIKSDNGLFFANEFINKKTSIHSDYKSGNDDLVKKIKFWSLYFNNIINSSNKKLKIDIALITALDSEMEPFLKFLSNNQEVETERVDSYDYYVIKTNSGKELRIITVTQQFMGMVDSAIISTDLFNKFDINQLFMIGICGGREEKGVKIGDIIIPQRVIAYQFGKITKKGIEANPRDAIVNKSLKSQILNKTDNILEEILDYIIEDNKKKKKSVELQLPKIHFDDMACGDSVINKNKEINKIAKGIKAPKICSVDMESYSVARLGLLMNKKTFIIKSVMDLTKDKNDKHKKEAELISAKFLYELLIRDIIEFENV